MTIQDRAELAIKAARESSMTGNAWTKDSSEIRVYLKRTNAARTEAGYIRLFTKDGKGFSAYVAEGAGKGSRTAAKEGESAYSRYKALIAAAKATSV